MKKMIFAALVLFAASFYTMAAEAPFRSDSPDSYVVQKGDTLWDISGRFLQSPWVWPEIWHVNPQIENPHLIFPGDVIRMIYIDGKPRLTVNRTVHMGPSGDARLEPTIRIMPIDEAISAISLDKISSFLSRSRIVMPEDVESVPYILAGPERRIIVGVGDKAYARGEFDRSMRNYGAYREEQTFIDEDTKEVLGIYALGIGAVRVTKFGVDGGVTTVRVTRSEEELRAMDILLPTQERAVDSIFYPSAPDLPIEGKILAVEGGVTQIGKMDIVIINKGERDQIQPGNVLAVYRDGEEVKDENARELVKLPDERGGLVMVYRVFEKLSFGIVMEAYMPLAVGDKLSNP